MVHYKITKKNDPVFPGKCRYIAKFTGPDNSKRHFQSAVFDNSDPADETASYNLMVKAIADAWEPYLLGHSGKSIFNRKSGALPAQTVNAEAGLATG